MQLFRDLGSLVAATWAEWDDLRLDRLLYSEQGTARQVLLVLIGLGAIFIVIRSFGSRNRHPPRLERRGRVHAFVLDMELAFPLEPLAKSIRANQRRPPFAQGEAVAIVADRLQLREAPDVPGPAREIVPVARDGPPRGVEVIAREQGAFAIGAKTVQHAGIETARTLAALEGLKETHSGSTDSGSGEIKMAAEGFARENAGRLAWPDRRRQPFDCGR